MGLNQMQLSRWSVVSFTMLHKLHLVGVAQFCIFFVKLAITEILFFRASQRKIFTFIGALISQRWGPEGKLLPHQLGIYRKISLRIFLHFQNAKAPYLSPSIIAEEGSQSTHLSPDLG